MEIKLLEGISELNSSMLCEWSNTKGEAFHEQWLGNKIAYPLDNNKIKELENLFSIFYDDEFIGVIQKVRVDGDNVHIGRFVINPQKTGLGLGKKAL